MKMTDNSETNPKHSKKLKISLLLILLCLLIVPYILFLTRRNALEEVVGPAADELAFGKKYSLVTSLGANLDALQKPASAKQEISTLEIQTGDTASVVTQKLADSGALTDSALFIDFLVYSGADRKLRPGKYVIEANSTIPQIAESLTDPASSLILFSVLQGMRLEEIAALIPSSGLPFTAEEFLAAAQNVSPEDHPTGGTSMEGYMLAGSYVIRRETGVRRFIQGFVDVFNRKMDETMIQALAEKGLDVSQSVVLASMIAREAMDANEYGLISSVFLNRLAMGMPFQSDPTVQYAIGWDAITQSWWKNPLTQSDLAVISAYNTYQMTGFPPAPISNFSFEVLEAIAGTPNTDYYFFRLRCDGSALHNFAATYAEHEANACLK